MVFGRLFVVREHVAAHYYYGRQQELRRIHFERSRPRTKHEPDVDASFLDAVVLLRRRLDAPYHSRTVNPRHLPQLLLHRSFPERRTGEVSLWIFRCAIDLRLRCRPYVVSAWRTARGSILHRHRLLVHCREQWRYDRPAEQNENGLYALQQWHKSGTSMNDKNSARFEGAAISFSRIFCTTRSSVRSERKEEGLTYNALGIFDLWRCWWVLLHAVGQ